MENGGCVVFNNIVIALYFVLIIIFSSNGFFVDCKIVVPGKNSESAAKHKNTVKTIESDDGDVIDCVDIYKQPAFDHPLLKNHTIQLEQYWYPSSSSATENSTTADDHRDYDFQSWHKYGECPDGTIPILRQGRYDHPQKKIIHPDVDVESNTGHEYAQVTMRGLGGTYYGARADINVWEPATIIGEISAAQLWLVRGPAESRNTLEVGWIVNPIRGGGTRSFIYWTADGYQHTGCYNLECPGFVQVSKKIAIGALLGEKSVYNGKQFELRVAIYKDRASGNWWLSIHGEALGYWPDTLFRHLQGGADYITWGGDVTNDALGEHHTNTQMGSGHFPNELYSKASYFRSLQYSDFSDRFFDAENLVPFATKPNCYDVLIMDKKIQFSGTHFYFGGPGFSQSCQT